MKPISSGYTGRDNPAHEPPASETDLIFLRGIMQHPTVKTTTRTTHAEPESAPIRSAAPGAAKATSQVKTVDIAKDVAKQCRTNRYNKESQELANLLTSPHLSNLLDAHDQVALMTLDKQNQQQMNVTMTTEESSFEKTQDDTTATEATESTMQESTDVSIPADVPIKVVGVRKIEGEPLGITVEVCDETKRLKIARILTGGLIEKQGMLKVGDAVLEVNNVKVYTPENLQALLKRAKPGTVVFKVIPSFHDAGPQTNSYVKALFPYDPAKDTLLPCKEIGLAFNMGDILQVVNTEDPNWWQAKKVGYRGPAGLIPSQELEERRRAFVPPEFDYATKTKMCGTRLSRHKRKTFYETRLADEFEKAELALYEEVTKMPPFERKTLVLVGAQGVGRRSLRNRLINEQPGSFGVPLPHTSRPIREDEIDGKVYHFCSREQMEADIADNKYLEWGEYGGHLYGTKLDSIRDIMNRGRMVILDCSPQYLKVLKSPEFMSYVVFIAAPPMPELRTLQEYGGGRYGSKYGNINLNLTFDRAMSRQSRRALTLQSLASLQEDEDLKRTIDESAALQRQFAAHFDSVIVNHTFDKTFDLLKELIESTKTQQQWVPISWVF